MEETFGAGSVFNTGTDEHGLKIYERAFSFGEKPQQFVDRYVEKFKALKDVLGLSPDLNFIRTTDPSHINSAQTFWKKCDDGGYIYKKNYKTKYCQGCELEKTDTDIEDGRCFIHRTIDLIIIEEENYFFAFSKFQKPLLELYEKRPDFVVPDFRFNEIKAFVKNGLQDFSISRLASKMPWGIEVPGDSGHVMYVWFDALVNYISAVGWPHDMKAFEKWWVKAGGVVQYCGKDNLRQQSAMWQAMLMAAGLPPSKTIVIDGFVTGDGGVKMSKSLGNTIDPLDIVKEYGREALRYYVCREIHPFEDSPFTVEKFKESFNANLANGLGNLVSRVMKMAQDNLDGPAEISAKNNSVASFSPEFTVAMEKYNIQVACDIIWKQIGEADGIIQSKSPFKLVKTDKAAAQEIIKDLCVRIYNIASMLEPIMPDTSTAIKSLVKDNKMPAKPLFMRK